MSKYLSTLNLAREDYTDEIYFNGRWYSKDEYPELQSDMGSNDYARECELDARYEDSRMEECHG